ncbi:MAG: hypothetical protein QGH11_00750 [Pirellulaceae bacterium]|nr:hypothetical protein [Pirellulaceae bacterium]
MSRRGEATMVILVGVDEAGYGPNYGPLAVAASAWAVPDSEKDQFPGPAFDGIFSRRRPAATGSALWIADSKSVFKRGNGLGLLEQAVLPLTALAHGEKGIAASWQQLLELLSPDAIRQMSRLPWYADLSEGLPRDADREQLGCQVEQLAAKLEDQGACIVSMTARLLTAAEFNEGIGMYDNKGELLSRTSLELVRFILDRFPDHPVVVHCDKHGGRNRYAALLQEYFPDYLVEIHGESRELSCYRWGPPGLRREVRFAVGGESFLPVALASMTAKYLRELAMAAFNSFWQEQVPGLKSTAGYPQDARRFASAIDAARQLLDIDNDLLWRCR